jgi:hypothetical protein
MKRVCIESPFGKNVDGTTADAETMKRNVKYLHRCMKDCFDRGEAPYASHAIYPQIFDDAKPEERAAGMYAGFAWAAAAELIAVYHDYDVTPGMHKGLSLHPHNIPVEYRQIGKNEEVK